MWGLGLWLQTREAGGGSSNCLFGDLKEKETYNLLLSFRKRKVFGIWGTGSKVSCLISPTYPPESWRRSKKMFEATHLSTSRSPHRQFWCETTKMIMSRLLTTHPGEERLRKIKVKKKPKIWEKKGEKEPNQQKPQNNRVEKLPPPTDWRLPNNSTFFQNTFSTEDSQRIPSFQPFRSKVFVWWSI